MISALKGTIVELFDSKKFVVSLVGVVGGVLVTVAGHHGIALDPATADALATKLIGMVAAYVVGQGVADHGKEAAKVEEGA